jgi:L-alanine-DL-glutamate epimerase-like enolase superfamily enzyme
MKIVDLNGAVIGEIPVARIVTGLPDLIVRDGFIEVWDRSGMGVDLNVGAARAYLPEVDRDFFD